MQCKCFKKEFENNIKNISSDILNIPFKLFLDIFRRKIVLLYKYVFAKN